MMHEIVNRQCLNILKNHFACRSQVSNYQTRNSDKLQIIRLHLSSQKRGSDYLMLLESIILNYYSCFSLCPILHNPTFAHLLKENISRTSKFCAAQCVKINYFRQPIFRPAALRENNVLFYKTNFIRTQA